MATEIRVLGHVDKAGHIEIARRVDLPPGEVLITIQPITAEMIAADEALWDEQFKRSSHVLAAISAEIHSSLADGTAEDFDPDVDQF